MCIEWLGQPDCHLRSRTGGKASQLSRLAADYRIPPGYCVTATAFEQWDTSAEQAPGLPAELRAALLAAYAELGDLCGVSEPPVAVRSSSVVEDGSIFSFAGLYETVLNVVGGERLVDAVISCWASARSDRVLAYTSHNRLSASASMAVLVQELVAGDVAAVAFSVNPITGNADEVVINANWGLGASIVNGTVDPDSYTVRKSDFDITSRAVAEKRLMTVPLRGGGIAEVEVQESRRKVTNLRHEQIREVARLAVDLEKSIGRPIEIEATYLNEKLNLLQCRPITALGQETRFAQQDHTRG